VSPRVCEAAGLVVVCSLVSGELGGMEKYSKGLSDTKRERSGSVSMSSRANASSFVSQWSSWIAPAATGRGRIPARACLPRGTDRGRPDAVRLGHVGGGMDGCACVGPVATPALRMALVLRVAGAGPRAALGRFGGANVTPP